MYTFPSMYLKAMSVNLDKCKIANNFLFVTQRDLSADAAVNEAVKYSIQFDNNEINF